jgi:hypothetical protein
MSCSDIEKVTGQHLLFLGVSTASWNIAQFQQAAQFAKAHGIDALIVKISDGTYRWYGGLSGYQAIKKTIQAEGVGVIPYTYSYGNKYNALDSEIDILIAYMQDSGVVCADMEVEWNGQIGWGQHLCSRMQSQSGVFLVSTWADPSLQNWSSVLQALTPCVSAYMPQVYSNYLGSFWREFGACLQPTLDMTQDFGPNDPIALASAAYQQGCSAISIWYYETAVANPALLDQILAAFPKTTQQQEDTMSIDLSNSAVAQYFSATNDPAVWQCKKTGFLLGHGILKFYCSFGGNALCGLTHLGLPLSSETPVAGHDGVVYQRFERGVLAYDPSKAVDNPPGSDNVYLAHIDSGIGQDPRIAQLQAQIATLQQPATTLQQINGIVTQAETSLAQVSTAIAEVGTALTQVDKLSKVQ